jgi:hypothetical protein
MMPKHNRQVYIPECPLLMGMTMSWKERVHIRGHDYVYERQWAINPDTGKRYKQTVGYFGACDKDGHIKKKPQTRLGPPHSAFPAGPLAALYASARDLKLRECIQSALGVEALSASHILSLALNQATGRLPLYHIPDWVRASPLPSWEPLDPGSLTPATFEEALSALSSMAPGGVLDNPGLELQATLTDTWRGRTREPAAYYYDITKQAYYGTECPYAALGHDATGGISRVVGFGMVVSRDNQHPMLCRPIMGSKNDTLTVGETVAQLQGRDLNGLTMVVDRGMVSKDNIRTVQDAGYHMVGLVRGWSEETEAIASRWSPEALESEANVVGRSHGGAAFVRAFTTQILGLPPLRVAVVVDLRRKTEDREARELALSEWNGNLNDERRHELSRELKGLLVPARGRRGFNVDPEAVSRDRKLDGRFLLFSTDLSMGGREMFETYFQRDVVEKVFRTAKGELGLGPIRYRRRDRVEAYATVVYMAWLLWTWTQRRLRNKFPDMTLEEAFHLLEGVSWVRFGSGKSVRAWATRLTQKQEEILSAVGATDLLPAP